MRTGEPEAIRCDEIVAQLGQGLLVETPIDFRKFAEDCVRLADEVETIEHKTRLLNMAEVWIRLADKAASVQSLLEENAS